MIIRKAVPGDLIAINEIYNQAVLQGFCTAHLQPVDREYREQWFAGHPPEFFPVFVAETDMGVAGWISLSPYRQGRQAFAHVCEVSYYVHRDARRKGIGSSMMEYAIRIAPDYGFDVLIAILLDRNPASLALLEKNGFARWGAMPGIARIGQHSADHLYYGLKL
ncbi:MAG: N-acetyltransferase family protein [Bacteroidetes bacterium]|nr:MAG: N-acetyltransferase family protein [Bacteroidota bacterium]